MDETRASTPEEAPPQDLWSSILDSASSSRSIPQKNVLILGQPSSGKSTLAAAILQKQQSSLNASTSGNNANNNNEDSKTTDFALGYDWADVRDDGDEDTLARLSVYTVSSADPSYTELLPHFLPPRSALPNTLVAIVLDWTRPWTFLDQLHTWLSWVENWIHSDTSREYELMREEFRERLQWHWQHYTEPSADQDTITSSTLNGAVLPLGQGTLTQNQSGIPIVVVCTKADLIGDEGDLGGAAGMGGMVKGKGDEWEERTDGILQVLRTVCLKYGASLFYTTQVPSTLQVLRQHILHFLFIPPAPSAGIIAGPDGATATLRNPFPFTHRSNTLDRDRIVVPAGWDSWGKIVVLREGFEPKAWGEAWESDLDAQADQVPDDGARKQYSSLVPDMSVKPPSLPPFNSPTAEQTFLAKNYDDNAKKADRDPRGAFRNPNELASQSSAGVVGPMGNSSFSLPSVERAWEEMEKGIGSVAGGGGSSSSITGSAGSPALGSSMGGGRVSTGGAGGGGGGQSGRMGRPPAGLAALSSSLGASGTGAGAGAGAGAGVGGKAPTSPGMASTPSPTGQTQHEVLQNFFQSLLSSKDRAGAAAGLAKPGQSKATAAAAAGSVTDVGSDDASS